MGALGAQREEQEIGGWKWQSRKERRTGEQRRGELEKKRKVGERGEGKGKN